MREHYIICNNIKYQIKDDPNSVLDFHLESCEKTQPQYNIRMIEGKLYYLFRIDQPETVDEYLSQQFSSFHDHQYVDYYTPVYKHKKHDSKIIGYLHSQEFEPTDAERCRQRAKREREEKQTYICYWIPLKQEYLFHERPSEI